MSERRPRSEEELVELVRSIDLGAPAALHERVEQLVRERRRPRRPAGSRWLRPLPLAGAAAALAALAILLVVLLATGSGTPAPGPLLRAAIAAASAPGGAPAPAQDSARPRDLDASVGGIAFPYWQDDLGWRASAMRSSTLAGRPATTVYYTAPAGERVGYTIVGGRPLARLSGGALVWSAGGFYHVIDLDGVRAVAWLQRGLTCVIAGHGSSERTLLRLATSA